MMASEPEWRRVWIVRVAAVSASASLALAALIITLRAPLKYPGDSLSPSPSWQSQVTLVLELLAVLLLVVGGCATVRTNARREGEPGYSTYGALLSLVPPLLLILVTWMLRASTV
jgi:hypothetical protein